jgi:signal transduction histidine kinase
MVSFASIYPLRSRFYQRFSWIPRAAWIVGGIVAVVMASGAVLTATGSPATGFRFSQVAQYAIWPFIATCTLLLAVGLASAYRGADDRAMRNRVRWFLVGVVGGAGPPIVLVYLARMLIGDELIPEPLALLFVLILPICLVISVVRHGLLDIDVVIHRGLMYGPATLIVAVVFGGGTILVTYMMLNSLVQGGLSLTFRTVLTLLLPLLFFQLFFETLRKRVQRVVDRIFFRTRYSYGETLRSFSEGIEGVVGGAEVLAFLVASIADVLGPAWLKAVDADGQWRSYWPTLDDGLEPAGPIPMLRIPFAEMAGIELWLGPKRSEMPYHDYDQALVEALTRLASVSLRREVLQRRLLEEESERERLAALTRLKDSFLSLVSHDLRGPLAAISLSAATIARSEGTSENDQEREAARRIQRNAQRLAGMVERLLHTALSDTDLLKASMRECELCDLVDEVLERFEELARNGDVRLSSQVPSGISISVDPDLLAEAISNLVDNAIRFTPAGREVSVSLISDGPESRILVSDQGPGIPADRRAGLFRREEQQKGEREAHRGFGVGLYLVGQLMELQGGGVELVQSGEGGSVFALHMPE